ncbi:MAG: hypothetical protein IIA27_09600 [Gemmatimonadetes bacterium]|nr:hypothetical protein [Gemmatimonadota bacterium]
MFRALIQRVSQGCVFCGAAVVVGACASGDHPVVEAITRDSAGIAIVENVAVSRDIAQWRFVEPPIVELGVLEGQPAHQFNQVVGATRLSDGRIAVADGGSKEVRFFDTNGRHLVSVGGPGEGPGEFRFLYSIDRLPGDTLIVGGWPIGWSAWYDGSGAHIEDVRLGPYFPGLIGRYLSDGSFLRDVYENGSHGNEIETWAARGEESAFRASGRITRQSRGGDVVDTIHGIMGPQWFKIGAPRQGLTLNRTPFGRTTHVAWSHDRIYVGETGKREIEVLRFDGTVERLIRWEGSDVAVTGADRAAFRDELLITLRRPERRADYERWLAEVPFPDIMPAFRALAADSSGRIWVQEWNRATDNEDRWLVFAPDGQLTATVAVPVGQTILDIGEDVVLTLWKDELDLEYVRLYHVGT